MLRIPTKTTSPGSRWLSRRFSPYGFFLLAVFAVLPMLAVAKSGGGDELNPLRQADTSSPRATLESFLTDCEFIHDHLDDVAGSEKRLSRIESNLVVDRILQCLDVRKHAEFVQKGTGGEAAVCLKEILDRLELPEAGQVPGEKEVREAEESGGLLRWRIPDTPITIERIAEGPRKGDYVFSSDTVDRAQELFRRIRHLPYKRDATPNFYQFYLCSPSPRLAPLVFALPDSIRTTLWGRHAVWQWIGLVFTLIAGAFVMVFAYKLGTTRARKMRDKSVFRYFTSLVFPLAAMCVPLLVAHFANKDLRISGLPMTIVSFSTSLLFLITAVVLIMGAGNRIAEAIISRPGIHPKGIDAQLIRITCRILSIVAAVIVFLEGGRYLGIPLTTLLAGAGVGGLAVALAAQDSLKNLFGSMMILLDKPYRVGERILTGGYDGIVEEIGLRSTRLRTLTGHQVTIPNESMARADIENIGRRPHIRRLTDLRLPIETPLEKVDKAVGIVRDALRDHEGMVEDFPPRAFFTDFNPDSLNIRMIYWFHPPNYWDFLDFSQNLNLRIKREFEAEGIRFAPPTSVTRLERESDEVPEADLKSGI